jgi:hypothetical protein
MDIRKKIDQAVDFRQYLHDLSAQLEAKKENEKILNYIYLNVKRMQRISKQYEPAPYLVKLVQKMNRPVTWLVITEGWCGDAAHVLSILDNLSKVSFKPTLKIILRDDHPELMDEFLTNGSRSIPKVLAFDENNELISMWGPRPSNAQKMVESFKNGESEYSDYYELTEAVQKWYHYDRFQTFESEIIEFIEPQILAKSYVLA